MILPIFVNCGLISLLKCPNSQSFGHVLMYRLMQKKGTVLLSTSLPWPAVAGQKLSHNLAPFLLLNTVSVAVSSWPLVCAAKSFLLKVPQAKLKTFASSSNFIWTGRDRRRAAPYLLSHLFVDKERAGDVVGVAVVSGHGVGQAVLVTREAEDAGAHVVGVGHAEVTELGGYGRQQFFKADFCQIR